MFLLNEEIFSENVISFNEWVEGRLEDAYICDILYLMVREIHFYQEKSGILKSYVCGNHVCGL